MSTDFEIKWNSEGLKNLEKQVIANVKKETQAFVDSFSHRYSGQSVDTIKPALQRGWRQRMDGTITDPELTEWATVISEGGRIRVR